VEGRRSERNQTENPRLSSLFSCRMSPVVAVSASTPASAGGSSAGRASRGRLERRGGAALARHATRARLSARAPTTHSANALSSVSSATSTPGGAAGGGGPGGAAASAVSAAMGARRWGPGREGGVGDTAARRAREAGEGRLWRRVVGRALQSTALADPAAQAGAVAGGKSDRATHARRRPNPTPTLSSRPPVETRVPARRQREGPQHLCRGLHAPVAGAVANEGGHRRPASEASTSEPCGGWSMAIPAAVTVASALVRGAGAGCGRSRAGAAAHSRPRRRRRP